MCLACVIHRKPLTDLHEIFCRAWINWNRGVAAVADAVAATFSRVLHKLICLVFARVLCTHTQTRTHTASPLFDSLSRAFARVAIGLAVYEHVFVHALLFYCGLRSSPALWNLLTHRQGGSGCNIVAVTTIPARDKETLCAERWSAPPRLIIS